MIYKTYTIIVCWFTALICTVSGLTYTKLSDGEQLVIGMIAGAAITLLCTFWWKAWEEHDGL